MYCRRQKLYLCLIGIGGLAAIFIICTFVQMGQNATQANVTRVIPPTTPFRLLPVNQGSPSSLDMTPRATLWKSNGGHEYLIIYEGKTWEESQRICGSHGAFLVTLDTPEEEAFLEKTENLHEYWLGLRRQNIHHPWRYLNGTLFDNRFQIGNKMGLCAYWNLYGISSTTCDNIRPCICRRAS